MAALGSCIFEQCDEELSSQLDIIRSILKTDKVEMQVVPRLALCAFLAVLSAMMIGTTSAAVKNNPDDRPRGNGDRQCPNPQEC
ncbi:hypothetical protein KEM48_014428 [Puccinia striiformis f. sp. tritici PST-130]|nr:hypothetical protein H4Q26_016427 [Puccinia striiformis f. sp. tritici PST-130]KAI9631378.1 hypothetical protein KEM48_014428 [Puccinia striiformis f. sp. tritici PST-130]